MKLRVNKKQKVYILVSVHAKKYQEMRSESGNEKWKSQTKVKVEAGNESDIGLAKISGNEKWKWEWKVTLEAESETEGEWRT